MTRDLQSKAWQLRVASESDRSFLYSLHCQTMREVIDATWGWDENWQQTDFDRRFSELRVSVIGVGGQPAGRLWLERRPETLHIVELQLLPEAQGRGIGTAVVQQVIEQGARQGVPITLSVVPANPGARRLYERLGFEVSGYEAPFIHMRHHGRPPNGQGHR